MEAIKEKNINLYESNNSNTKNRIEYMDIANGIGIILVIIGHMPIKNEYCRDFIYSFHMPLFFLISGYFFKHTDNKKCLRKIFKSLIIPYVITCILIILYKIFRLVLQSNFSEIPNAFKIWGLASLYGSGDGEHFGIISIGAIWFLLALAFATYFMNYIYNKKYRYLYVLFIAYIGYKTSQFVWLPLSVQAGMVALLYVYIGILMKKYNILNRHICACEYIFLIAMMIFNVKYGGKLYMVTNTYENGLLDVIISLSNCFLCIKLSMIIDKFLKILKMLFKFIGENSLICLCAHLISLDCFKWKTWYNILNEIGIHNECLIASIGNLLWVILALLIIKSMKKTINLLRLKFNGG